MKLIYLIFLGFLLSGCGDGPCRLPGCSDGPSQGSNRPTAGCNQDVNIIYSNQCGLRLLVYFIEVSPNSNFDCSKLEDYGSVNNGQTITVTVHTSKIGFIVFSETPEGKCTGGRRKFESWIHCENASSSSAYFNICQ